LLKNSKNGTQQKPAECALQWKVYIKSRRIAVAAVAS
jgi:hypothetical protein